MSRRKKIVVGIGGALLAVLALLVLWAAGPPPAPPPLPVPNGYDDLLRAAALAPSDRFIEEEATIDEIHHTIHAHPTLSEALGEAALATLGKAIHT